MKKLSVSFLGLILILSGCGGGGSSSNDNDSVPLSGIWRATGTSNDFVALAFFEDGTYLYAVYDSDSSDGNVGGMELGTYSLDAETNLLTTTQTIDFNEGRGLSENISHFVVVNDNSITVSFDDNKNSTIDEGESLVFEGE